MVSKAITQTAKSRADGYMRISANIQDGTDKGRSLCETPECVMMVIRCR
jgi:hypothetical protein